ncbi:MULTISPECIES: SDR family NAD(P)-dependent oxidoreductase [Heyndrickxia]|uniref:SDR family NAD(P)-dependent oxidoreductase n=1 Tax=Heyndrickxia TaxID=2837504 RepID=UPI000402A03B|nr:MULTISPECIES: SDR family oxidoreductase [Heyndrickxia]MEC2304054.1 SDR family NAD(P)-dependent oxidoreductase [Weizmannia sp. CD-2023]MEC2339456.1 SDR family NAD(P)-dependent oxidoreductase [Weizmannia sp. CD-2023]
MASLENKIAIVTGGASGIGLATAKAFTEKGAKVVISDYNEESGKAVEKELTEKGADVCFIRADASDEQSVADLVAETVNRYGRVDIMVNNAGIGVMAETHELSFEDYQKVISVNQNGVFFGSKYAIREMLKTGGGCIVNTSSILGYVGEPGAFAYNASKGAVNLMTKSLALEYASKGIRVNAVNPGYVETGMVNKEALGDFYDGLVARHPIGRLGRADEIAHAIVFLCENEFVTGIALLVDGGYTAR